MISRRDLRVVVDERSDLTRWVRALPAPLVPDQPGLAVESVAIHQLDRLTVLHLDRPATGPTPRPITKSNMDPQRLFSDVFDADDLDALPESDQQLTHACRVRFHEGAPDSMT